MTLTFALGLVGSLVLVTGAAWKDKKKKIHPAQSTKNWLFAIGALIMLIYAYLGYLDGGSIFFVMLELLIIFASLLMMFAVNDKINAVLLTLASLGFVAWSLTLFEDLSTLGFVLGLCGVALGYAFDNGTVRRNLALTLGSLLIAAFSFYQGDWIFFGLNAFFALFSAYYLLKER